MYVHTLHQKILQRPVSLGSEIRQHLEEVDEVCRKKDSGVG